MPSNVEVLFSASGRVIVFVVIGVVVSFLTTRLQESEAHFRGVAERSSDIILLTDMTGKAIYVSPSIRRILGYDPLDLVGKMLGEFIHPDDLGLLQQGLQECLTGADAEGITFRFRKQDGDYAIMNFSGSPIITDSYVTGIQVIGRDVTRIKHAEEALQQAHDLLEQKVQERTQNLMQANQLLNIEIARRRKAEEALREESQYLEKLIDYANSPIVVMDPAFRITRVNYATERQIGRTAADMIGKPTDLFVVPHYRSIARDYFTRTAAGDILDTLEIPFMHKDGSTLFILWNMATIYAADEKTIIANIALGTNITERKRVEEAFNLSNRKLALMTDVTYQDIQNKVTALRAYVALARNAEIEEDRISFAKKEEAILESIHGLIKKTKEYQEIGLDQSRWILLEPDIRLQGASISTMNGIALNICLPGLECYTDPMIDRVFYNLIENAVKHGKTLTHISFYCRESAAGIVIVCEDDGIGIPPEKKTRIFDRVVGGSGHFGLFFVREFLTISDMTIAETSEPGKGARFEISVPKEKYRFTNTDQK